jgi:hypothetical protein
MWIARLAGAVKPSARDRAASARPAASANSLHALQRLIGNGAVARALGGRSTDCPPATVQRDDAADMRAMGQKVRLATHAADLNDLPDAELKARVAAMSIPEVKELLGAVPLTSMHRIRGELLSRMYDDCVQRKQWKEAITYLQGFDDTGIVERVNRVKNSPDDRRELIVASLDNSRVLGLIRTATGLAIDEKKPFGELKTDGFAAVQEGKYTNADAGTITIRFEPNPDLVSADEIAFIQTIRRVYTGSNSAAKYSYGMDDRATKKGTAVDRFGKNKYGYFGYENSGQTGPKVVTGHCKSSTDKAPSSMTDTPGKISGTENIFEACAVAKSGKDTGRVYGCLVWGFTVDGDFGVTVTKSEMRLRTSSEFDAAVGKWNAQAKGDVGGGATGQQSLPPAR